MTGDPTFTEDWIHGRLEQWPIDGLRNQPSALAIEIGCFEGRATLWMLENVLTAPDSRIICIDPFEGLTFHHRDPGDYYARFLANTLPHSHKVIVIKERSQLALREEVRLHAEYETADLIYIDGNHSAAAVLEDAVLAWRYLRPGGLMIFDDYDWHVPGNRLLEPAMAVEAFTQIYAPDLTVVQRGFQVIVRKRAPTV